MPETYTLEWLGDELLKKIEQAGDDALMSGGEALLQVAEAKAPVDDGDLRDSGYVATAKKSTYKSKRIHRKEIKPPAGVAAVAFAAFYAHMVERGTKPHDIKPRKAKALRIGNSYVASARHPGTRAQPFLRPALDESHQAISEAIAKYMRDRIT